MRQIQFKLLFLAMFLLTPTISRADIVLSEILGKIKFNAGVGYDSKNKKICNTETMRLIGYSGFPLDPSVDVGFASNDNFTIGASFSLVNAKKLGIDIPILDLVDLRPQVLYGWGNINMQDFSGSKNTVIYGASIINIKF